MKTLINNEIKSKYYEKQSYTSITDFSYKPVGIEKYIEEEIYLRCDIDIIDVETQIKIYKGIYYLEFNFLIKKNFDILYNQSVKGIFESSIRNYIANINH